MSSLSKILVVLLVLLAIAHSAVLLAYLSQQQDWKALAQARTEQWKNEQALRASEVFAFGQTREQLLSEKRSLEDRLAATDSDLINRDSQIDDLKLKNGEMAAENDVLRQELTDLNASLERTLALLQDASGQLERARNTANQLKAENTQLERRVSGLTMDVAKLEAEIRDKKERVAYLESEIRKASGRVSTGSGPVVAYPQPDTPMARQPIKGRVTGVDLSENIATVNVGSIAGVSAGTMFIIYSDDQYVGDLKITSVLRDHSIGTIVLAAKPVEIGNEVATSLLE